MRRIVQLAAVSALVAALSAGAAAKPAEPTLSAALAQLQAGNAADAARALRRLTVSEPRNAQAWRALGTAEQQLHNYDEAIAAYQHALQIEPDSPRIFYALGTAYASKHDSPRAFEWLERAAATHRYDMTQISVDPALAELRSDPRFAQLLPKPAQFENPFVESVKIIREWRGEASGDQFGWIARNIGDVDGDGVNDIVTSAPTHGAQGANAGRIYVYSVGSGRLLWTADGMPGDQLGTGVEAAGDTNGDGIPDVVASGPSGPGVADIYSGQDGRVLQHFKSSHPDEAFGNHISGAGDVNRDGYADVIVGARARKARARLPGTPMCIRARTARCC